MTDRELMQQALDALANFDLDVRLKVIPALRARLAEPEPEELGEVIPADEEQLKRIAKLIEPEPVAWMHDSHVGFNVPLYTAPPQREWQGLTENEIKHLWYEACQTNLELTSQLIVHLARNIEAKLKERNT